MIDLNTNLIFSFFTPIAGTYYAAQLGIGLSGKDHAANLFLGNLLDVLERMKKDLVSHDAIRDENVASAYVENFALKVFAAADNEDRSGRATRFVVCCISR